MEGGVIAQDLETGCVHSTCASCSSIASVHPKGGKSGGARCFETGASTLLNISCPVETIFEGQCGFRAHQGQRTEWRFLRTVRLNACFS